MNRAVAVIMKKRSLVYIIIFSGILLLSACGMSGAVSRMTIELESVRITDMTFAGFDAKVYLRVTNPNWFTVGVSDLSYRAYISGREVASGQAGQEISIPSGAAAEVILPVKVTYGNLGGKISQAFSGGKLDYRLAGSAVFHTWFASKTVQFDTKTRKLK